MSRNGSGVKVVSKSSVEIEFQLNGVRCRERIKCNPDSATLKRIALWRLTILAEIESGTFDYSKTFPESKRINKEPRPETKPDTMAVWLDKWLDRNEKVFKSSTYTHHTRNVAALKKVFGDYRLTELRRRHIRSWCETLTCGNKRIAELLSPLKGAIECAVDDEILDSNHLRNFTFKRLESPKEDYVDPLAQDEAELLLSSIDGPFKNLVQFAIWTGLRTSELVALEWGDIDFYRSTLRVQRALTQQAKSPEITKTRTGTRDVNLLAPATDALNRQKPFSFMAGKQVFLQPNGKPYTGDYQIWKAWQRAMLKAGIRYRSPYQTRHTYASMMLSSGEPIAWVASQMGHSSPEITAKHYARFMPTERRENGSAAVELFTKKRT